MTEIHSTVWTALSEAKRWPRPTQRFPKLIRYLADNTLYLYGDLCCRSQWAKIAGDTSLIQTVWFGLRHSNPLRSNRTHIPKPSCPWAAQLHTAWERFTLLAGYPSSTRMRTHITRLSNSSTAHIPTRLPREPSAAALCWGLLRFEVSVAALSSVHMFQMRIVKAWLVLKSCHGAYPTRGNVNVLFVCGKESTSPFCSTRFMMRRMRRAGCTVKF